MRLFSEDGLAMSLYRAEVEEERRKKEGYVKVIRCMDCAFSHLDEKKNGKCYLFCNAPRMPLFEVSLADFCSRGREGDRTQKEKAEIIEKLALWQLKLAEKYEKEKNK